MVVYLITNKITGVQYVGQTVKSLNKRWKQHIDDSNKGKGYTLHKAIRKYGDSNFYVDKLHVCLSSEEMDFCETFYISLLKTKTPLGYNILEQAGIRGAHLGHKHSEETKEEFSRKRKGRPAWNKGIKMSADNIEKNRQVHLGIKWKSNRKINNSWIGRVPTKEHRLKISKAKKGKGKPWTQIRWDRFLGKKKALLEV